MGVTVCTYKLEHARKTTPVRILIVASVPGEDGSNEQTRMSSKKRAVQCILESRVGAADGSAPCNRYVTPPHALSLACPALTKAKLLPSDIEMVPDNFPYRLPFERETTVNKHHSL